MKKTNPILGLIAGVLAGILATAAPALADNVTCDQGAPGNQGGWVVTMSGTSSTSASATSNASTWAPAKTTTTVSSNATTCSTAGGASCTRILASTQVLSWPRLALTIQNTGANALSDVLVEFSADGSSWEVWDNTTFASLAAGGVKSINIGDNARRYIRIEARSASGTTTDVWLTASQG